MARSLQLAALGLAASLVATACLQATAAPGSLRPASSDGLVAPTATARPTFTSVVVPATTTPQPTAEPTLVPVTDAPATLAPATDAPAAEPTTAPTRHPTNPPNPPTRQPTAPPPPPSSGYPGGVGSATGPVPPNMQRYVGRVTDAATGLGIAGVCVYAGPPQGCPSPNLNTDASGYWALDFPSGFSLTWNFQHPAYGSALGLKATSVQLVRR